MLTRPGQPANTYGRFTAELLKADGLADLEIASLDQPETLARLEGAGAGGIDAVIVTRMLANKAQTAALAGYVRRGGRLIAIRPSRLLSTALGLTPLDTMLCPAYVRPAGAHPVVAGVPQEAIQTHVAADKVEGSRLPPGGVELARLYGDARTPTSFPAVVAFPCGEGEVVLFTYDVAHAVALIRQGDPRLADGRALGTGHQYRPEDLLVGHADPLCWHLPQADIHGMLLGNAVNHVARAPQPRWWYYPTPETKSVVVLDSDDDWSAPEHFDALINSVERHGGHITIYLMLGPTKETIATPRKVEAWRARGHSFGIHHNPYDPAFEGEEQDELLEGVVRRDVEAFRARYGEVPLTNRNHCVAWKGYVDLPRLYAELGVRMDLNVVSLRSSWLQYLNGSGRPMRFVDLDGTVLECFQQATQAYDDASVKQRLACRSPRGGGGHPAPAGGEGGAQLQPPLHALPPGLVLHLQQRVHEPRLGRRRLPGAAHLERVRVGRVHGGAGRGADRGRQVGRGQLQVPRGGGLAPGGADADAPHRRAVSPGGAGGRGAGGAHPPGGVRLDLRPRPRGPGPRDGDLPGGRPGSRTELTGVLSA